MFAVIKTGGKQYKVAANDILKIEKLPEGAGDVVTFDQVLMVGEGTDVTLGAPLVAGAMVAGQLIETKKQKTIIVFKKERRHNYRRRNGHRQLLSTVRITEILTGGAQVTTQPDERARARYAAAQAAAEAQHSVTISEPVFTVPHDVTGNVAEKPASKAAARPAGDGAAEAPSTDAAPAKPAKPRASKPKAEAAPAAGNDGEAKPATRSRAKKAPKADKE